MALAVNERYDQPGPNFISTPQPPPLDAMAPVSRPPSIPYRSRRTSGPPPAAAAAAAGQRAAVADARDQAQMKARRAVDALRQRHRQLQQREVALQRAADNLAARTNDAAAAQRRRELTLAAQRYSGQRQLLEAEWRLKRQERQLNAERNARRRLDIERQMDVDRQNRERLLRVKMDRDRAAQRLREERIAAQAEQRAEMRMEERNMRQETAMLASQRLREQQMRASEAMLRRVFGGYLAGPRLRSLAGRLSLFAAQTKLHIRDAFDRMMRERLHIDAVRSEADLYALESELDAWAVQRGYEADRFADSHYLYPLLDRSYADPYWTDYYNRYACFSPDYDWTAPSYSTAGGGYANEVYWDDPLLSGDPLSFSPSHHHHHRGGLFGDAYNDFSPGYSSDPLFDAGYGSRGYDFMDDGFGMGMDAYDNFGPDDFLGFGNSSSYDLDYGYNSPSLDYDFMSGSPYDNSYGGGGYLDDGFGGYSGAGMGSLGAFDSPGYGGGYEPNRIGYY